MDFTNILIILGVIALVLLIVHGFWSNRREKSQVFQNSHRFSKENALNDRADSSKTGYAMNSQTERESPSSYHEEHVQQKENIHISAPQNMQQSLNFEDNSLTQNHQELEQEVERIKISLPHSTNTVSYSEPREQRTTGSNLANLTLGELEATDQDEGISIAELREQLAESALKQTSLKPEREKRLLMEEQPQVSIQEPVTIKKEEPVSTNQKAEFIMLYVVAAENREFNGVQLAQSLESLGFIFGDRNIYHRHVDLSIASPVLFSVANIEQPGTFDVYNMSDFSTIGIVLFMPLPSYGDDSANLRLMIRAAKTLAEDLGGIVLDEQQEMFDKQTEQLYLTRVASN